MSTAAAKPQLPSVGGPPLPVFSLISLRPPSGGGRSKRRSFYGIHPVDGERKRQRKPPAGCDKTSWSLCRPRFQGWLASQGYHFTPWRLLPWVTAHEKERGGEDGFCLLLILLAWLRDDAQKASNLASAGGGAPQNPNLSLPRPFPMMSGV